MNAVELLQSQFGGQVSEFRGETTVRIDRSKIFEACRALKEECAFDMLTDVSGVDNYGDEVRYEVVYHLYSMSNRTALRLKASVPEDDLIVDSVVSLWKTADWHEREAYDMFGIRFRNHPNLKRILMWDGYPYYPLRKDFPLAGIPTELPETAVDAGKVETAPMLGGPFVSAAGTNSSIRREPRQADTASENLERLRHPTKKELV
jgi:NADH-quinone oxidoreductase subunit C